MGNYRRCIATKRLAMQKRMMKDNKWQIPEPVMRNITSTLLKQIKELENKQINTIIDNISLSSLKKNSVYVVKFPKEYKVEFVGKILKAINEVTKMHNIVFIAECLDYKIGEKMNNLQKDFIILQWSDVTRNKDIIINLKDISFITQELDDVYTVHSTGGSSFTVDKQNYNILKERLLGE